MDWIKRAFFFSAEWVVRMIGKIHLPWVHLSLDGSDVDAIRLVVKEGDFLIVRASGWLTSFILGDFSHCAYVYDAEHVFDSTGVGVEKRSISSVLVGYNRVALIRPDFTPEEFKKMRARTDEILRLDILNPIKYNYSLVKGNKLVKIPTNLTCAQLLRDITNAGREDYMGLRSRFGFNSIAPSDYFYAKSKFTRIIDIKK